MLRPRRGRVVVHALIADVPPCPDRRRQGVEMAQQVRAVVARAVKQPVEIVTIEVPDPGPGEALVRVQACGVCHTDLHYREGGINDDFPFLLGHEAAGVVEAVGEGVAQIRVGQRVVYAASPGGSVALAGCRRARARCLPIRPRGRTPGGRGPAAPACRWRARHAPVPWPASPSPRRRPASAARSQSSETRASALSGA